MITELLAMASAAGVPILQPCLATSQAASEPCALRALGARTIDYDRTPAGLALALTEIGEVVAGSGEKTRAALGTARAAFVDLVRETLELPALTPFTMAQTPKVSVCISHFNRPVLLEQAIESLRRQDYPNVEVLIVDDASSRDCNH